MKPIPVGQVVNIWNRFEDNSWRHLSILDLRVHSSAFISMSTEVKKRQLVVDIENDELSGEPVKGQAHACAVYESLVSAA